MIIDYVYLIKKFIPFYLTIVFFRCRIRTQAVKFLEGVVLLQTYPDPDIPRKPDDFSLEDIPLTLKIARRRKLEEEANHVMDLLIKFHGSPHVSSVNLMTCMGSLALIAKTRPQFMSDVIQGCYSQILYILRLMFSL